VKGAGTLFKLIVQLMTLPAFRALLTTLDYLQIVAYTDKDDLAIILGHLEEEEKEKTSFARDFLNSIRKTAPEGILQVGENSITLTFFIDEKAREEVKKHLA